MENSWISETAGTAGSVAGPLSGVVNLPPYEYPFKSNLEMGGEQKYLSWDFRLAPMKTLELLQITDVQWGSKACKVDRVLEYRDWVLSEPNRYMIWTGDNIDAATLHSKGTPWDNKGTPQEQVHEFVSIWVPARHRILGYVGGNHERRSIAEFGDLGVEIASQLRVPYSRGKQLIDIYFGEHKPFQISQWHGMGGARTYGTVAQILMRFAQEGDSQLYLMGHLHKPMIIPFWKERRGEAGVRAVKTIAALGSSFLETWGSYGEVSGYGPSDVLMPRTVVDSDGGWEVTLR